MTSAATQAAPPVGLSLSDGAVDSPLPVPGGAIADGAWGRRHTYLFTACLGSGRIKEVLILRQM
jgi:hypothetical protein